MTRSNEKITYTPAQLREIRQQNAHRLIAPPGIPYEISIFKVNRPYSLFATRVGQTCKPDAVRKNDFDDFEPGSGSAACA